MGQANLICLFQIYPKLKLQFTKDVLGKRFVSFEQKLRNSVEDTIKFKVNYIKNFINKKDLFVRVERGDFFLKKTKVNLFCSNRPYTKEKGQGNLKNQWGRFDVI